MCVCKLLSLLVFFFPQSIVQLLTGRHETERYVSRKERKKYKTSFVGLAVNSRERLTTAAGLCSHR